MESGDKTLQNGENGTGEFGSGESGFSPWIQFRFLLYISHGTHLCKGEKPFATFPESLNAFATRLNGNLLYKLV